jgi:hypothetical protein
LHRLHPREDRKNYFAVCCRECRRFFDAWWLWFTQDDGDFYEIGADTDVLWRRINLRQLEGSHERKSHFEALLVLQHVDLDLFVDLSEGIDKRVSKLFPCKQPFTFDVDSSGMLNLKDLHTSLLYRQIGLCGSANQTIRLVMAMLALRTVDHPTMVVGWNRLEAYVSAVLGTTNLHRMAYLYDLYHRKSTDIADCLCRTILIHYRDIKLPGVSWQSMNSREQYLVLLNFVTMVDKYCKELTRTTFSNFRESTKMCKLWNQKYLGTTFSRLMIATLFDTWTLLRLRPKEVVFSLEQKNELVTSFRDWLSSSSSTQSKLTKRVPLNRWLFWTERINRVVKNIDDI